MLVTVLLLLLLLIVIGVSVAESRVLLDLRFQQTMPTTVAMMQTNAAMQPMTIKPVSLPVVSCGC